MEFLTTNSLLLLLLVVSLFFLIYQLYFKIEDKDEQSPPIVELGIDNSEPEDKILDKEILEAVKIAVRMHREKKDG